MPKSSASPPELPPIAPRSFGRLFGVNPLRRRFERIVRWFKPSAPPVIQSNLPDLIHVFAAFTRVDGEIDEAEVDSILGFLRYDYPESLYGELRARYLAALQDPRDLDVIADSLASRLGMEEKILLGVQLYMLVSRSGMRTGALAVFYRFMTALGIAGEAIDIVYQLNARGGPAMPPPEGMGSPLESLVIGPGEESDVRLENLPADVRVAVFRYRNLVLLKNIGDQQIVVRGRALEPGGFSRLYEGQQLYLGEVTLAFQELLFYFNARRDLSASSVFLHLGRGNQITVERKISKQSLIEVRFGLATEVKALKTTELTLNGNRLAPGETVKAALGDALELPGGNAVRLGDLRRRARDMGGRFELVVDRNDYLVSNNPSLLRPGDILLSPGAPGDILLRITCDQARKSGSVEVLESPRPILLEGLPLRGRSLVEDGEMLTLSEDQFLRCHFSDRIIEEERNIISRLEVADVSHSFNRRESALDSVSFEVRRGEMVCVMGPSGCGKSTLLRILAGQLAPLQGQVKLNGIGLYGHRDRLHRYIAFMPHEEGFDPLLTVEENLATASAVRAPHFSRAERQRRIEAKLAELGLKERRDRLPGEPDHKALSHGERKRLNIGMDVIGISDIYLFDEPTSGLSSKDSENVLEIIRGMAHNKIILVSIHQPSARLFHMFHKALLLDHGGRMVFFGTPSEMLDYFNEAYAEEGVRLPGVPAQDTAGQDAARRQPEFIFDVLETPVLDPAGDVIHEEDRRGRLRPARRFPPSYWRDRFQAHRLLEELSRPVIRAETEGQTGPRPLPEPPSLGFAEELVQWFTQIKRSFLAKLRNKANLATTLIEAPALAVLVAMTMRYSEDGPYTFGGAFHIPTYLFLSLVVAMFLGLTNSADEIIRDRAILRRERNHHRRHVYYVGAKVASLSFFSAIQCLLYLLIGNAILGIRDMMHLHLLWMFLANLSGVVTGLFISATVRDAKTALNIIPLVLIPQIILGGALIKYEEMNRDLDFLSSFTRWRGGEENAPSKLEVPAICELMPLRWAYEGMVLSQARLNPLSRLLDAIDEETERLKGIPKDRATPAEEARLELLKEARIPLVMARGRDDRDVSRLLREFSRDYASGTLDPEKMARRLRDQTGTRARDVYWNEKTRLLYEKAEIERTDNRRAIMPNVFFGSKKIYFHREWDTMKANLFVLAGFILAGFAACVLRVRILSR